jgi:hypothetical protein
MLAISARAAAAQAARDDGPERLVLLRVDFSGNLTSPLRESLTTRLTEGLTSVGFEVQRPGSVSRAAGCTQPDCLRELADRLDARYLVAARVEESAKTFEITLELYNGRTGVVVGTSRERCEICGAEEVGEKMSLAAASVRARLQVLSRAPVRFVIRTRPHGAAIQIDDKAAGETPVDLTLAAGAHHMRIERPGFSPLERSFTVTSGVDETLDLDLVKLPSPFPFRAAGWSALAGGAVLAAAGVYFLRMDGREVSCAPSVQDPAGRCPRVYRTNALGAALLGASAVSATLGGVWLYLAPPAPGSEHAFALGASARF